MQKEDAGEHRLGVLAPLPPCFLLEPSLSWAVREKWGYWLPIPNITQTMENSRKRAKTRCREGDQGPARRLGELQRISLLPNPPCANPPWCQRDPREVRASSEAALEHQSPEQQDSVPHSCQWEAVMVLGNPQLLQNGPSMTSRNRAAHTWLIPCSVLLHALPPCHTTSTAAVPSGPQPGPKALKRLFPRHPRCLQAEKPSPISPACPVHFGGETQ